MTLSLSSNSFSNDITITSAKNKTSFFSPILNLFQSSNSSSTNVSINVGNTCCLAPILGDTSKAADMTSRTCHDHNLLSSTLCGFTGYISAGATLASVKTTLINQKQIQNYAETLTEFQKDLSAENAKLYEPIIDYLHMHKEDVTFLRNVPGIMSAVASALIGIGMFTIWPVSLAGLSIGVIDGGLHLYKSIQLIQRYEVQIKNIEKNVSYGRAAGALLTVIGVSCLVVASLSMTGFVLPGVCMAALMAGIVTLSPAIYLSIKYNAYQDMGLRKKERENILEKNISFQKLIDVLNQTYLEKENSDLYRSKIYQQNKIQRFINEFKIIFGEFITIATFNLPEKILSDFNRGIKEVVSDSYYNLYSFQERISSIINTSKNKETLLQKYSEIKTASNEEEAFFQLLSESSLAGKVIQLIANQALSQQNHLVNPYKKYFENSSFKKEIIEIFQELRQTAPCCEPYIDSEDFKNLLQIDNIELKNEFKKMIVSRFDQFMIFSLNNLSQKNGRIYSRLAGAYHLKASENSEQSYTSSNLQTSSVG